MSNHRFFQVKTDLLRVFSTEEDEDAINEDDSSRDNAVKGVSVDLLKRKIDDLQKDNQKLHEEATEVRRNKQLERHRICFQ